MALPVLLHITTREAWARAFSQGTYRPPSLETEGFIHLSLERQWLATAARFYRGQSGLVLLVVQPSRLLAEVRFEAADGDEFPHLYGELPASAVARALPLAVDEAGHVSPPDGLAAAIDAASI